MLNGVISTPLQTKFVMCRYWWDEKIDQLQILKPYIFPLKLAALIDCEIVSFKTKFKI